MGHHDNRSFGGYGYYGRTGARSVTTVLCGATRCAPSGLCRGALPYGAPRPRAAAVRSLTVVFAGLDGEVVCFSKNEGGFVRVFEGKTTEINDFACVLKEIIKCDFNNYIRS